MALTSQAAAWAMASFSFCIAVGLVGTSVQSAFSTRAVDTIVRPAAQVQTAPLLQYPAPQSLTRVHVPRGNSQAAAIPNQGIPAQSAAMHPLLPLVSLAGVAAGAFLFTIRRSLLGVPGYIPLEPLPPVHMYGSGDIAMASTTATVEPPLMEAAPGVLYNSIAREWRCKWETEEGLSACQKVLDKYLPEIKALDGVEVQRTVCGGCKDFKVVITIQHPSFGDWQAAAFAPEKEFLEDLKKIPGINHIETQTYTWQTLEPPKVKEGNMQELAPGILFNRIAREWRCKWSEDKGSASLVEAQQVIDELLPLLRSLPGAEVQRVVCGGCKDLKVITSVPASVFDAWKEKRFKPEENFLNEVTSIRGITQVEVQTYTLQSLTGPTPPGSPDMNEKAKGVYFNRVAREWRCKWSTDNNSASLTAAQKVLDQYLPKLKAMDGVQVQRVVCGGCLDFKVIISVPSARFGSWMDAEYDPEPAFLKDLAAIPGITQVETQTYTLQPLDGTVVDTPAQEKAPGIVFTRVAREWRCKFNPDNNRASLVNAQKVLNTYLPMLAARSGARVQRAVCLECNQFKVVTSLPTNEFGVWKDEDFPPEEDFLATLQRIEGLSDVETQTYTFETI